MHRQRDVALDVVRACAVLSMLVAHFAPSGGPGGVLNLSEYLTLPLFATVVGWSAELGRGRRGECVSALVRGAVLVALGLLLERLPTQIIVVLVWLGVLVVLAPLLVRVRTVFLVPGALLLAVVEPWLLTWGREQLTRHVLQVVDASYDIRSDPVARLWELTVAGPATYRLSVLLPFAALGVVLARWRPGRIALLGLTGLGLVVAGGVLGADQAGALDVAPYDGSHLELVVSAGLVLAAVAGVRLLVAEVPGGWVDAALSPLGRMALTAYVVQVVAAWRWLRRQPVGGTDDSWVLLGGLAVVLVVGAALWGRALRGTPLARGPVEAPERLLIGWCAGGVRR